MESTTEQERKKYNVFRKKVDGKMRTGVMTEEVMIDVTKGDKFPVYPSFAALMGKDGNAVEVDSESKLKIISNHLPKATQYWKGTLKYTDHDP